MLRPTWDLERWRVKARTVNAKVTADRSRGRVQRVRGAQHHAASLDNRLSRPDHGDNGAALHVRDQAGKKALALQVLVMLLQQGLSGLDHLQAQQLEAARFEALHNLTDKSALDTVRLNLRKAMSRLLRVTKRTIM